ncbi:MAG: rod shape-determining protein RodA [Armatimonadota bacterium]|nr:rod shape-determining protein RodA [Armatimonadota bacterium]
MRERRLYRHLDWGLVAAVLALCAIGVVMIFSATGDPTRGSLSRLYMTQLSAIGLGVLVAAAIVLVDYRRLADSAHVFYVFVLCALLVVLVFGPARGGARRWIPLGFFNVQPSEFAKVVLALVLARFFAENQRRVPSASDLAIAAGITAVPFVLIARQPDLGTAFTLAPILLAIAFLAGMRMRLVLVLAAIALLTLPVAWRYALQDYQRSRISTFLDPAQDPRGAGYQQIQARITVGSGGVWGKGFRKGTQGQLRFLPVAHNDFIFSVLAEEQGLVGVLVALGLYLYVLLRSLQAARLAKDRLGAFLVMGIVAGFGFQVIYNITMSAGLAPVKGLTLPLMSYGGSAMIATLAGFGVILNVGMRRFTN